MELLRLSARLRGKRVVHVNATSVGGGVAEMLRSFVPYFRSLGVQCDWYCINPKAGTAFFTVTNKIHNALQGAPIAITKKEWGEYERVSKLLLRELEGIDCDVLAINDPQPLLAGFLSKKTKRKIYINHIDTSKPFPPVWRRLSPLMKAYDELVFSNRDFINSTLSQKKLHVFTPAIDPLAPKQRVVSKAKARNYLEKQGKIPAKRPLIVQVSRFDVWKNPLGVVQAFRMAQQAYPSAVLALVGFREAKDNPAAEVVFRDAAAIAGTAKDIFLFFSPKGKSILDFTVMAQNGADVIVQNSIREGFGLTVTEAMWKRQPVIGGPASGIRRQIVHGQNGFIAKNDYELAKRITFLLGNPKERRLMGERARQTVSDKFLMPRLISDHLQLYIDCLDA